VSRPPCRSHSAQDRFNYPSLAPGAEHRLPGPRRSSDVAAATTYERCAEMFRRSSAGRRHQPRGHLLNYGERYCSRLRNWPRYWIRGRICRSRGYFLSASSSSKEAARASLKSALTLCWVAGCSRCWVAKAVAEVRAEAEDYPKVASVRWRRQARGRCFPA
jgi:hypothetical protein